jgi:hypothetical protein
MRTLLVGALIVNLVGCSHQSPLAQTAADSCASRNPLACWMSVPVSIEPTHDQFNVGGSRVPNKEPLRGHVEQLKMTARQQLVPKALLIRADITVNVAGRNFAPQQ